ncbi:MAG: hypothetical protein ACJ75Q_01265 [Gaiellaceae bacterium]
MRKALAIAAVASLAAVPAAGAGSTKAPTLRSLQAQITSLQKQVKALKKKTALAQDIAVVSLAYGACSTAVTADTLQDTYTGLNGYFGAHALPAYFGAQTAVNDFQACSALEVVRAHNQNPPTTSVLAALLDLFKPSGGAAAPSFMSLPRSPGYVFGQLFALGR